MRRTRAGGRRLGLAATATMAMAGAAWGQDAPPAEPAAVPKAASWSVFSRGPDRSFLVDVPSIARADDEASARVARVLKSKPAGDYSHTVDAFAVRCRSAEARVVESSDVAADGQTTDTYVTGEPWERVREGLLDDGVRRIVCENERPAGAAFPSIRAYIDAGRP